MPSRSRPTRLHAMLSAGLRLDSTADFLICLDEDDPAIAGYRLLRPVLNGAWPGRIHWRTGPRDTMPGWTNTAARSDLAAAYRALGSLGDDHLPKTAGWAAGLAAALPATGIAFGDDLHQHQNLPTCWLMYRAITDALGWMCLPGITHFFADTTIGDLGATYVSRRGRRAPPPGLGHRPPRRHLHRRRP